MVNSKKENGKNTKKDWYTTVMITQTIVGAALVVLMLFSVKTGSELFRIMSEGYREYMTEEISPDEVSEAFVRINEYADVFAETDIEIETEISGNEPEEESQSVISAGGKDLEFTSLDALEGICFENIDTGFSMSVPVTGYTISSPFGYRIGPISGEPGIHTGLDFAAGYGTEITAAADGVVVDAAWDNSYGNYIKLSHENNTVSIYAHCSSLCVDEGEEVRKGDTIAKVGSTGDSTGNHLHFEVRKDNIRINPGYLLFGE